MNAFATTTNVQYFNPLTFWLTEIDSKRKIKIVPLEIDRQVNGNNPISINSDIPNLIDLFNQSYSSEELMISYGYEKKGNTFRHPNSESGSYSASIKNGRVHTLSPNDPLYVSGTKSAHDAFSVFRTLKHGGDIGAALKDAGDNLISINGDCYNKVNQAQYRAKQAVKLLPSLHLDCKQEVSNFKAPSLHCVDSRDGTKNTRALTELGNAQRLFDAHGKDVRYIYEVKSWLRWKNCSWAWDINGSIVRSLSSNLPEQIYIEGSNYLKDVQHFVNWSRTSQKERTIKSVVSLLEDFEQVRISMSSIDANIFKVGIDHAKQVIDLSTGIVSAAQRSDFITKSLNVSELGDSNKAVRWLMFLSQIFGEDEALIHWLKCWCGYLLTGDRSEQIIVFFFGLGANGKSVFADAIHYILGDYARTVASETLIESKRTAGSATPDIAALIGARLALASETEDGAALAESLIKSMSGDGTMTARALYSSPIEFIPQFKLLILGNHKPIIKGNDYGIWRRVCLVPFKHTFSGESRDSKLLDKLKNEAPHILAWMVEGCLDWRRQGLEKIPNTIKIATEEYRQEQDLIGNWLSECCILSQDRETLTTDLYSNYKEWALRNGLRPASNVSLGRRLSERGLQCRKSNSKKYLIGIALDSELDNLNQ